MAIELINEDVNAGARQHKACAVLVISCRTMRRWQATPDDLEDKRGGVHPIAYKALNKSAKRLIYLDQPVCLWHLRIKRFVDNSKNTVKTQTWCAVSTYVLIAIVKKELQIDSSLHTLLQILSVSVLEKTVLYSDFQGGELNIKMTDSSNQLNLFEN